MRAQCRSVHAVFTKVDANARGMQEMVRARLRAQRVGAKCKNWCQHGSESSAWRLNFGTVASSAQGRPHGLYKKVDATGRSVFLERL